MRAIIFLVTALVLVVGTHTGWANDTLVPCDRITGGGFIIGAGKAQFGFAAGCRKDFVHDDDHDDNGDDDEAQRRSPRWGHLEFSDKAFNGGLKLRSDTITGYFPIGPTATNSKEPTGTRTICGTGRVWLRSQTTNRWEETDVFWIVTAQDAGEPGRTRDIFTIQVFDRDAGPATPVSVYSAGPEPLQGGNIQLHKPPRRSSSSGFSEDCGGFI